ncbi:MAG: hypothetical protein FWG16_03220 [Micrococcales bacterium]|nr:hypothetical protein [Micrococcales bacterium]
MGLDTEGFDEFEHLAAWWEVSEDLWRNHGRSKGLSLVGQINYMGKMAAQLPIAPIRIVYSTSGTRLTAALVRDRTAICDNRLYWAPISSIREGHYLTAVLNSGFVQSLVEPLQSRGQFGPRDFHLLPFELPIPLYNRELPAHNQLAKLGAKAECQAAALTLDLSKSFQTCRRQVRAALQESGLSGTIDNAVKELLSGNGAG